MTVFAIVLPLFGCQRGKLQLGLALLDQNQFQWRWQWIALKQYGTNYKCLAYLWNNWHKSFANNQGHKVIPEKIYCLSVFNKQPSNSKEMAQAAFLGQHFVCLDTNFVSFGHVFSLTTCQSKTKEWLKNKSKTHLGPTMSIVCLLGSIFGVKRPTTQKAYAFESCSSSTVWATHVEWLRPN